MQGHLAIVLHAHLPFVRHPEHEKFLEENWFFEAITETYLPLIQTMDGWLRDGMETRLTLTLSPTLCSMLLDPLLQERYLRHLDGLIELAEKEIHRTHWEPTIHPLAWMYHHRFTTARETYFAYGKNLVGAFRKFQEQGRLEIITTAATHALLPLMAGEAGVSLASSKTGTHGQDARATNPSIRAQILVARDHYRSCFGCDPRGIWLPECAYVEGVETILQEANIRWFIIDTHGILHAKPRPRCGVFAPIFTPNGIAAFGRDLDSARQVWSREEGYPGDATYRDFYRDVGFDLDLDYVKPYLPSPEIRGFTGIKYHRITGGNSEKQPYQREAALHKAAEHAQHFLNARIAQAQNLSGILGREPIILSPYDAELFGHWWYEGIEFLDYFVRKTCYDQNVIKLTTPNEYLRQFPTQQVATPSASSWGEEGYWRVWLNETNEWIHPHLHVAQERMTKLARTFCDPNLNLPLTLNPPDPSEIKRMSKSKIKNPTPLEKRALNQAARELLLAQSSDWPFILRTGTSPDYARKRVKDHLLRFISLHEQLTATKIDEPWLTGIEAMDNIFPEVDFRYWV